MSQALSDDEVDERNHRAWVAAHNALRVGDVTTALSEAKSLDVWIFEKTELLVLCADAILMKDAQVSVESLLNDATHLAGQLTTLWQQADALRQIGMSLTALGKVERARELFARGAQAGLSGEMQSLERGDVQGAVDSANSAKQIIWSLAKSGDKEDAMCLSAQIRNQYIRQICQQVLSQIDGPG
jgi:hypothetical protein